MLGGQLPSPADLAFHIFFFVTALAMMLFRNEMLHKLNALLAAATMFTYIALLFMPLR
jgi:hypothetical protein